MSQFDSNSSFKSFNLGKSYFREYSGVPAILTEELSHSDILSSVYKAFQNVWMRIALDQLNGALRPDIDSSGQWAILLLINCFDS